MFTGVHAFAQQSGPPGNVWQVRSDDDLKKSIKEKTLASWDLLGILYQVSVNDVTTNAKSLNFKSTIYGIHKLFDSTVANSDRYRHLSFERNFEPNISYKYQGSFSPDNISIGVNYSIVHANDLTTSPLINDNKEIAVYEQGLADGPLTVLTGRLLYDAAARYKSVFEQQQAVQKKEDLMTKFMLTGDPKVLDADTTLKAMVSTIPAKGLNGENTTLLQAVKGLSNKIDATVRRVKRRWNIVFTPTMTYALSQGAVQGAEFALNSIKGLKVMKNEKLTSQLIVKGSYKIGDDTIIQHIRTGRHEITDQVGFNQVLVTKHNKVSDGTSADQPCVELSFTGGYNWVMSGLMSGEKSGQPVIQTKLGLMFGKETWLVFPFSYNFSTNKGWASVSLTVNLGDAPFK